MILIITINHNSSFYASPIITVTVRIVQMSKCYSKSTQLVLKTFPMHQPKAFLSGY